MKNFFSFKKDIKKFILIFKLEIHKVFNSVFRLCFFLLGENNSNCLSG